MTVNHRCLNAGHGFFQSQSYLHRKQIQLIADSICLQHVAFIFFNHVGLFPVWFSQLGAFAI